MEKNCTKEVTKALKLFKIQLPKGKKKTIECENSVTNNHYSFGESEKDARMKFAYTANGNFYLGVCSGCIADYLVSSKSTILINDVARLVVEEQMEDDKECETCKGKFKILYKFDNSANVDCGAGICDACLSNLLVDNGYKITPSDDLFHFKYKNIGYIQSDSDTIIIGDPSHLIYPKKPFKTLGKNWKKFVKKSDPMITNFSFEKSDQGLAISISASAERTGGIFPVFAEIEDGKIKNIMIDFEFNVE